MLSLKESYSLIKINVNIILVTESIWICLNSYVWENITAVSAQKCSCKKIFVLLYLPNMSLSTQSVIIISGLELLVWVTEDHSIAAVGRAQQLWISLYLKPCSWTVDLYTNERFCGFYSLCKLAWQQASSLSRVYNLYDNMTVHHNVYIKTAHPKMDLHVAQMIMTARM